MHHHRHLSPSFAPDATIAAGELRAKGDISFANDPALDLDVSALGMPISAFAAIAGLGDMPAGAQIAEDTRERALARGQRRRVDQDMACDRRRDAAARSPGITALQTMTARVRQA